MMTVRAHLDLVNTPHYVMHGQCEPDLRLPSQPQSITFAL